MAAGGSVGCTTAACVCSAYPAAKVAAAFCTSRVEATAVATVSTVGVPSKFMRLQALKRNIMITVEKTNFFILHPPYQVCSFIIDKNKEKAIGKLRQQVLFFQRRGD
jgi:hypothetical protein